MLDSICNLPITEKRLSLTKYVAALIVNVETNIWVSSVVKINFTQLNIVNRLTMFNFHKIFLFSNLCSLFHAYNAFAHAFFFHVYCVEAEFEQLVRDMTAIV